VTYRLTANPGPIAVSTATYTFEASVEGWTAPSAGTVSQGYGALRVIMGSTYAYPRDILSPGLNITTGVYEVRLDVHYSTAMAGRQVKGRVSAVIDGSLAYLDTPETFALPSTAEAVSPAGTTMAYGTITYRFTLSAASTSTKFGVQIPYVNVGEEFRIDNATLTKVSELSSTSLASVNTPGPAAWGTALLDDVLDPGLRQVVYVESVSEITRDANVTTYDVLNSPYPVAVQGVMRARAGSIVLAVRDAAASASVWNLLENSTTLLLRTTPEFGIGNLHFVTPNVTEERVTRLGYMPHRRITVEFIETDVPVGDVISSYFNSWQKVASGFATWAEVAEQRLTWSDVLTMPEA
jgi:hypothetical protein